MAMIRGHKIVVEINGQIRFLAAAEYECLISNGAPFKLKGTMNPKTSNRLNSMQLDNIIRVVENNVHYLANKSPEQLIKNFKDSVIKELKR